MSLITSCPACGTMFRVVPDQLKISEGWVRCGHCGEIFDASTNLSDESVLVEPEFAQRATRPADLPTRPAEMPTRPADLTSQQAEAPVQPPEAPPRATPPPARATTSNRSDEPSDFFEHDSEVPLEPSPLDAPFVFRRSEIPRSELRDSDFVPVLPGRESQLPPEEEFEDSTREELENVSFVRQARRQALWRRPGVRIALAVSSVLLALLLALQAAYQDRDRLALAQPGLRPSLERMCALLNCTLGAPRQIEAVVIESSGFNRLRNDTYRVAFTLRNTAPVPVAVPAMELTITDSQDQTIARRVLLPQELGAEGDTIPAAGEWSRAAGVVLSTDGGARIAGYRLLAFYP
jgi:predicted Zn finger-like uncharacterized protein